MATQAERIAELEERILTLEGRQEFDSRQRDLMGKILDEITAPASSGRAARNRYLAGVRLMAEDKPVDEEKVAEAASDPKQETPQVPLDGGQGGDADSAATGSGASGGADTGGGGAGGDSAATGAGPSGGATGDTGGTTGGDATGAGPSGGADS